MKIEFVYGVIPVAVFFGNMCVNHAAKNCLIFIMVKKDFRNDRALIEHELVHSRQFYRTFFIHPILYKFSKKYKYKSELEAYLTSIKQYGFKTIKDCSWIVDTLYDNHRYKGLTRQTIREDIINGAKFE